MVNKLQTLLISQLTKYGNVKLLLPDNMVLEIGVNQLNDEGKLVNTDDYCWIMASREDKMTILDSYNCGLRYTNENSLIFEDVIVNDKGETVHHLDVV